MTLMQLTRLQRLSLTARKAARSRRRLEQLIPARRVRRQKHPVSPVPKHNQTDPPA